MSAIYFWDLQTIQMNPRDLNIGWFHQLSRSRTEFRDIKTPVSWQVFPKHSLFTSEFFLKAHFTALLYYIVIGEVLLQWETASLRF